MSLFYTEDVCRVEEAAQRHALRLQCDAVGVEHLALALIEYGRGPVEEAFFALGVSPGEAWATLESLAGAGSVAGIAEQVDSLPNTQGAGRVLGLVFQERVQLRHQYIGCEHLLLALLRHLDDPWAEPELASELFERLGVDLHRLREELLSRIPVDPVGDQPPRRRGERIRGLPPMAQMDWLTES